MAADAEHRLRRTARVLLLGVVVMGAAAVLLVGVILVQNARESQFWSAIGTDHQRSLSIEGQIAEDLSPLERAATDRTPRLLLCGAAIAAAAFLVGWRIRILRRIDQIRRRGCRELSRRAMRACCDPRRSRHSARSPEGLRTTSTTCSR